VPKTSYQNLTSLILRIKEINKHEFWILRYPNKNKTITLDHIYSLINLQQDNSTYKFR
jgi:hypothetical protein